jgi:predicted component of type VI protein secretion system
MAALLEDCLAEDPSRRPPGFAAVLKRLSRAQPSPQPAPRLLVVRGQRPGAEYLLLAGPSIIGRGGEGPVDVDLEDQEPEGGVWLSRRHALVHWRQGRLTITDLHSAHGTLVNSIRVPAGQEHLLHDQDILQIGSIHLRVLM